MNARLSPALVDLPTLLAMVNTARSEGVRLRLSSPQTVRLVGKHADDVARWKARLTPFKPLLLDALTGAAWPLPDRLRNLLALHGAEPRVNWGEVALIDAVQSALWVVQRPAGGLTLLATVAPISKPVSYAAAWPAQFLSPEPTEATPAAQIEAQHAIAVARAHCTGCTLWRSEASRPVCRKGHPLTWRRIGLGGVRTVPSRADTAKPCPDADSAS